MPCFRKYEWTTEDDSICYVLGQVSSVNSWDLMVVMKHLLGQVQYSSSVDINALICLKPSIPCILGSWKQSSYHIIDNELDEKSPVSPPAVGNGASLLQ